jgi:hypothetical protein
MDSSRRVTNGGVCRRKLALASAGSARPIESNVEAYYRKIRAAQMAMLMMPADAHDSTNADLVAMSLLSISPEFRKK